MAAKQQSSQNKMASSLTKSAGPQFVDKKRFAEAVKLNNDGSSVDFASGQMLVNELVLNAITITEHGTIQVPVSLLVIWYIHTYV